MSQQTFKTVSVGYAYPTSPAAEQFGFGNRECWVVTTITRNPCPSPPEYLAGFANLEDAKRHASTLGLPFEDSSLA